MKNKTLFNLIQIFGRTNHTELKVVDPVQHCERNQHHDYYCDAERPHISQ